MASHPTYDPAEFVNGISRDAYRRLSGNGDPDANALMNRAITAQYSPGSTFKLVTASAALLHGIISPSTRYNDGGSYNMGGSVRRNAGGAAYGSVDVSRSLTVSSDVFFYWIGDQFNSARPRLGDGIQETARQFGFGAPTGIGLPDEVAGNVPDPEWKARVFASLPPEQQRGGDGKWYGGDSANLAIGQGDLLVTPLQLANAYATFVAHGVRHQPNLLLRALAPGSDGTRLDLAACAPDSASGDGTPADCVVQMGAPVVQATIPIPDDAFAAVHTGLVGVPQTGTAARVFAGFDQQAFPVLGKTGTVESGRDRADSSAFVAAGPVTDPRFVAASYLEHSGFGSEAAAPVVRSIFDAVSGQDPDVCGDLTGTAPKAPCATPVGGRP
jgi:penicillin-binding protein 2